MSSRLIPILDSIDAVRAPPHPTGPSPLWLALLLALLLLTGCAEPKYLMRLDTEPRLEKDAQVWPAAPETARYRYVGQLKGDDNFVLDETSSKSSAARDFFYWLIGLVGMGEEKVMLVRPQSGFVDNTGRVLVTDAGKVMVFDQAAGKLQEWRIAYGDTDFVAPIGIAQGADGQTLVADAELGRVFRLDRDGKPLGEFGTGELLRPTGLARDAQRGRVYVSDTAAHEIKVFDDSGKLLQTIGQRGNVAENELNFPTHIAFAADKLYVSDTMNARVQTFDAGGAPTGSLGQRGLYFGNMVRPKGVTLDGESNLYVAESLYDYVLIYNRRGEFLMPLGASQGVGKLYQPAGLWFDRQGRLYVADMYNGRVVIFQFLGGS